MADDEDTDRWLDVLAGRGAPASTEDMEPKALRAAMLRHETASGPTPRQTEEAWRRMAFRLRREGLDSSRRVRPKVWIPFAIAATLVMGLGVNVYRYTQSADDLPVRESNPSSTRGAVALIEMTADDPIARAQTIGRAVKSLDLSPVIYAHESSVVLQLDLASAKADDLKRILATLGVAGELITADTETVRFMIAKKN